jgi:DNA polymerase III delta prime subunit
MNLRKEESKAHTLWDTLVGDPDHAVRRIEQLMQPGTMMNPKGILATGSSGLGKTMVAEIIAEMWDMERHELNASDERGIGTVREQIKTLCQQKSAYGQRRMIHLDECDGLTKQAQDALRRLIEKSDVFWMLTANDESAITDALKSRLNHYRFRRYNANECSEFVARYVDEIADFTPANHWTATVTPHEWCELCDGDLRRLDNLLRSNNSREQLLLSLSQDTYNDAALSVAGGAWGELHRELTTILNTRQGGSRISMLSNLHRRVKSLGLPPKVFQSYSRTWGKFVLRANEWPLDDESFIDFFVGSLAHSVGKEKKKESEMK